MPCLRSGIAGKGPTFGAATAGRCTNRPAGAGVVKGATATARPRRIGAAPRDQYWSPLTLGVGSADAPHTSDDTMRRPAPRTFANFRILTVFATLAAFATGCAQQVGDIDRTQTNVTEKADLDGVWYYMETVVDVPPTAEATFEGETSRMEKVVWRIEENYLFAYRSYPLVPGAEDVLHGTDYGADDYHEEPVAAFPIISHFDIRRQYNSSTGEETNVIEENGSDREWYEREYMRVDWSRNEITNFDFISDWIATPLDGSFTVDSEREDERGIYWERDEDDELVYFDVPRNLLVSPDLLGCFLSWPWYGVLYEDCTAARIEVVSAFARTEPRRDYEPLAYDDQNMSRFGYFRSERYVFDQQRGVLESGRSKMINRHDIWQEDYVRDDDGTYARDDQGRRIPIPIDEREVRTVTYYLNTGFDDDELMLDAAFDTLEQWNEIGRDTVAIAQGVEPGAVDDVFVLCQNPVADDDHAACGEPGFSPRPGDLRYSTFHLVESETQDGLLGYGPSAVDPETGETVSGRAYVYGAAVNTYASYALDVIRFTNGDLDPAELQHADHVREQVLARANEATDLSRVDPSLRDIPLGEDRIRDREALTRREIGRENLRSFDRQGMLNRFESAREAGLSRLIAREEFEPTLAAALGVSSGEIDPGDRDRLDPGRWLSPTHAQQAMRRRRAMGARAVCFADLLLDPNIEGLALHYAGRDDYDQIWRELRRDLFLATSLHEIGHTVGLRHNFQGSYDSLNYFDEYWNLRRENLSTPGTMFDLYELTALTDTQVQGRMREYQYSSIMDYGLTFNSDIQGLGRYDRAAMIFGYSGGSESVDSATLDGGCEGPGRVADGDRCLALRDGYVEVFSTPLDSLGRAGEILSSQDELGMYYEDPIAPTVPYNERWHYTTFMQSFPTLAEAFGREWMRLDDYLAERASGDPGRHVRVPYLFCSDEWEGALLSCHVFDGGADPFEVTRNVIDEYRSYYYFQYFKRDRLGWAPWNLLFRHFYGTFLPLSDYYQSWYLSPDGYDEVMDDYYWMAVNMGFNLIAESFATPEYGTFCTTPSGSLFNLTDDAGGRPDETSAFYLTAYCDADQPFSEIPQGDGRRHFSAYDPDYGYIFGDLPQEAGHYWSTLAAAWALFDPEAFVLASDGDAGTFAITYYDLFDEEIDELVGALITEDYGRYSPVMQVTGTEGDNRVGTLHYRPIARVWDSERRRYVDPETGVVIDEALGPQRLAALCEPCTRGSDCSGYTGEPGGTFCQPLLEDDTEFFCVQDCTDSPSVCEDDEACDERGNCVPESASCAGRTPECSGRQPNGRCDGGQACVDGDCVEPWPLVETDATFSLMDDLLFYGMYYSTSSWSTRYNDRLNVYKIGTGETIDPGEGFELVTFTDPILGDTYGAVREACETSTSARCEFGQTRDTAAVQMVVRGQELADRYDALLRAYWEDDGSDFERELALYRVWARSRWELEGHIEKLNDIRAIFNIFGRVY